MKIKTNKFFINKRNKQISFVIPVKEIKKLIKMGPGVFDINSIKNLHAVVCFDIK